MVILSFIAGVPTVSTLSTRPYDAELQAAYQSVAEPLISRFWTPYAEPVVSQATQSTLITIDHGLDAIDARLARWLPWQLVLLTFAATVLLAWTRERIRRLVWLVQDKGGCLREGVGGWEAGGSDESAVWGLERI